MVKSQNLITYIGKVAVIIYVATIIMIVIGLVIDVINFPNMLFNNLLTLGIILIAVVLQFLKILKMSFSLGVVLYSILFNILLGLFNVSHGDYQVHFFMRNSLFIIYLITLSSLMSHKIHGIIIALIYFTTYISLTLITGDQFLKDTLLLQLSLLLGFTAAIYYFINAFEKSIHEQEVKSDIILDQNKLLNKTNLLLKQRQLQIESQAVELESQKEELTAQKEELEAQKEELTKINVELNEVVATKDKFFSIIAHDLRNPLNALIGFSELLYKNADEYTDAQKEEISKAIYDSSLSAFDLLDNLLIWSRMQMGVIQTYPEKINLYKVIDGACFLLENMRTNKNIELDIHVDQVQEVHADKYMLASVVNNLLSNAIKFTYVGGTIKISSDLSEPGITRVCIADSGIGISQENISKLFRIDKGFSVPGTNDETGTGLGLLLCKEFIERNGGKIWVESEPGKGSHFFFTVRAN